VTSAVWSPRLKTNVALGQLAIEHTPIGTTVMVQTPSGEFSAEVSPVPFGDPTKN